MSFKVRRRASVIRSGLASCLFFSLSAMVASGPNAVARNIIGGFTKAPTFTPPPGCVPREHTYGVLSRCEKTIEPGRAFVVLIDTAAGAFIGGARNATEIFVKDHVAEIKAHWLEQNPRNSVSFSSRASGLAPGNAPRETSCMEYSITVKTDAVVRVEGLTCAWRAVVKPGGMDIELFWLEAYDTYRPSIGQKPMSAFDPIVRDLFASVRL